MRHAITANLCPFCGNSIFSVRELGLRKSIGRVLIKNGLDNDDTINRIVDDILALATGAVEGDVVSSVSQAASPTPRKTVDPGERDEDGLTEAERNAPSRRLTPAPKPTAQSRSAAGGSDAIAAAIRAFEEDNTDPMRLPDAPSALVVDDDDDDDDASGIFFMEASASALEAERRKGVAHEQASRTVRVPEGQARTAPAFKRVS
jgi:hypothetical protein